jgi:hypothetical protein
MGAPCAADDDELGVGQRDERGDDAADRVRQGGEGAV